jgi:galactonate dehydratase
MSIIKCLRTIRIAERPNLIWVELETDEGLVGLGESFRGAEAVEAVLHETVAPWLIGRDSRRIEAISRQLLTPYLGFASASAEVRAASAVDLALWDLTGKRHGIPVHEALGGASRTEIRTYNTCAGYAYNSGTARGTVAAGRRDIGAGDAATGPYDDQIAFMRDAGALAESLLSEGFTAMKIWPLDVHAAASGGQMITLSELKAGLEPFRKIRAAVGDRIEVMAELHSLWSAPAAIRICQALEDLGIFWAEDPIAKMVNFKALADLRRQVRVPICGSETLGGSVSYRQMLEAEAVDVVMLDLAWCGGLTEGRKIAALAEAFARPLAPHDCTGPVTLMAGLQLALHAPTAIFQEVVRATLATWYRDLVTDLPVIKGGMAQAPTAPGLGTALLPEVRRREDAVVREYGTPLKPGG